MLTRYLTTLILLAFCANAEAQYYSPFRSLVFGYPAIPCVFAEPLQYVGTQTTGGHTYVTFQTSSGALFRGEIVNMQYVVNVPAPQVIPQQVPPPSPPAEVTP